MLFSVRHKCIYHEMADLSFIHYERLELNLRTPINSSMLGNRALTSLIPLLH
jgi:hypothetical protein